MTPQERNSIRVSWQELVAAGIVLIAILGTVGYHAVTNSAGESNLYVHQAVAFLHGQLSLATNVGGDVAFFNGRYFVPFPPFPAVLLVPFVAILGPVHTNVVVVAVGLTFLSVWLMVRILRSFELAARNIVYAIAAFYLGTGYWSAVMISHGVHYFAQVVAITALLGAIAECLRKQRPLIIMLFWGAAFLSRQCMLFSWVFLVGLLAFNPARTSRERLKTTLTFALSSALPVAAYLMYNQARFGNPFDTGYSLIMLPDGFIKQRVQTYGIFNYHYIPVNSLYLFLQGFSFNFSGPMLMSAPTRDLFGTSLTFASPFLFFAFYAKWNRGFLIAAWVSVVLGLLVALSYHVNGWVQINTQRYTLDFSPILFLLAIKAVPFVSQPLWRGAVIYSVTLNVIALFIFPVITRLL